MIPFWVVMAAHAAISLGTLAGGWRIIHTMGSKITRLQPVGGFAAETAGAVSLFTATALGVPVSTTHTITGAIIGVGSTRRLSAVRWGIAGQIVWAWILTIPASAGIAAITFYLLHAIGLALTRLAHAHFKVVPVTLTACSAHAATPVCAGSATGARPVAPRHVACTGADGRCQVRSGSGCEIAGPRVRHRCAAGRYLPSTTLPPRAILAVGRLERCEAHGVLLTQFIREALARGSRSSGTVRATATPPPVGWASFSSDGTCKSLALPPDCAQPMPSPIDQDLA